MTNETMYTNICIMLQEYDQHTGNRGADGVISNPEKWINSSYFPFYASAAALLIEARAKLDTKTTPRTVSAAIGRIIKNAPDYRPNTRGIFSHAGKFAVCDGFHLIRFSADITSLPHVENDFDVTAAMYGFNTDGEPLQLPSVADVKAFISADKAKHPKSGKKYHPTPYSLGGVVLVNPLYLIDMLQALPGCTAYKPSSPISPIYFAAPNGDDGILLPVRPPKEKENENRAA